MEFGDRVKEARQRAGISQSALAHRAEMSLQGVAKIEQGGVADPHYSTLQRLADALGVNPLWLVAGKEAEEPVVTGKAEAPSTSPSPEDATGAGPDTEDEVEITESRIQGLRAARDYPEVVRLVESLEETAEHVEYVLKRGEYDLREIWHLEIAARAVYAEYRGRRSRLLRELEDSAPQLREALLEADERLKAARDAAYEALQDKTLQEADGVTQINEFKKERQKRQQEREEKLTGTGA